MQAKKILIIQTAFLGDTILITPLIKAIKDLFPTCLIDVVTLPKNKIVFQNNPHIDEIICFDKSKKFSSFFDVLKKIKANKYEISFLPHSSFTTTLLAYFGGIKKRIGFNRRISKYFLTDKVNFRKDCLRIEKNLDLLKIYSDKEYKKQTKLYPSENEIEFAESKLKNISNKTIAIAPGSIWVTKRWGEKNYTSLLRKLPDNISYVFLGAKEDSDLCQKIIEKLENRECLNLAGESSILESTAILQKCELLLCNDSGAMHIANAVGTQVVSFFGPTVKDLGYFPFREKDFVFEVDLPCRPCGKHGHKKCPLGHHDCMKMITPEMVYSKIKDLF